MEQANARKYGGGGDWRHSTNKCVKQYYIDAFQNVLTCHLSIDVLKVRFEPFILGNEYCEPVFLDFAKCISWINATLEEYAVKMKKLIDMYKIFDI